MPRFNNRSFRALAETQNRKAWGEEQPRQYSALEVACIPKFEDAAHRSQAAYLAERRDRLVRHINDTIRAPRLFWDHTYFRHLPGAVLETNEAVQKLGSALYREQSRSRARHWSANPGRIPELREAMVFARYFRRFGQRVWMRQMEAA